MRVGIAGLGRAGWGIHAETIARLPEMFRVVAVSDPDASRQQEARARFDCRAYGEYGDLVKDAGVELIVMAVPSQLHADYAVAALENGQNVLVEKPMANSLADVERMIAAARAGGRILTVNQNYRNMPVFLKVREIVASGMLGRIVMIRIAWHNFARRWDWQTLKEFSGGQLNNAGAHFVDLALLLLGDGVEPSVFCHMERTPVYSGDAESHAKIVLHAPGRPLVDIELTSVCAYAQDQWLVMGTQGGLTGNGKALRWKYFDPQALPPRPVDRTPTPDRSYNREQLPWVEVCYEVAMDDDPHGYVKTYRDLYGSLKEGKPLAITAESVRRQIAILDQCREQNPDM
ncbi:MAG: Gfo/Idh/MocA family oxidoreductase [Anaerolineae bacterium]|nr:Gfo/Idh/MocA family oxidoreductase [Anaerolineae bacterium]